jgi:hypothetical protein
MRYVPVLRPDRVPSLVHGHISEEADADIIIAGKRETNFAVRGGWAAMSALVIRRPLEPMPA